MKLVVESDWSTVPMLPSWSNTLLRLAPFTRLVSVKFVQVMEGRVNGSVLTEPLRLSPTFFPSLPLLSAPTSHSAQMQLKDQKSSAKIL